MNLCGDRRNVLWTHVVHEKSHELPSVKGLTPFISTHKVTFHAQFVKFSGHFEDLKVKNHLCKGAFGCFCGQFVEIS